MLKRTKRTPFQIPQECFLKAYKSVRENRGGAGVDKESLLEFGKNLRNNLYKLWNRMSAGSYFPPAVKAVPIPKKSGGTRILGVPTVGDRVAQMVVKMALEPMLEPHFLSDSYGYRPNKCALDAIKVTRERCWKQDWVLEFDIRGLFDNIPHDLLLTALKKHTNQKWILLYIERWLKAPMELSSGERILREKGTPQGGVISPLLSNLFLHYVFDYWLQRHYPHIKWCRYADDGLIHCNSKEEALELYSVLKHRFAECGLELHPKKTKIVYCQDDNRKEKHLETSFDFLGFTFRSRAAVNGKTKQVFFNFLPSISKVSLKSVKGKIKSYQIQRRSDLEWEEIAELFNPMLQGWINYYGFFYRSGLYSVFRYFHDKLIAWVKRKYKKVHQSTKRGRFVVEKRARKQPSLFAHWKIGMVR